MPNWYTPVSHTLKAQACHSQHRTGTGQHCQTWADSFMMMLHFFLQQDGFLAWCWHPVSKSCHPISNLSLLNCRGMWHRDWWAESQESVWAQTKFIWALAQSCVYQTNLASARMYLPAQESDTHFQVLQNQDFCNHLVTSPSLIPLWATMYLLRNHPIFIWISKHENSTTGRDAKCFDFIKMFIIFCINKNWSVASNSSSSPNQHFLAEKQVHLNFKTQLY